MSNLTITDVSLQRMLMTAAELGARRAMIGAGMDSPMLSYRQACKRFGKSYMELWNKQGKLNPISQGFGAMKRYYVQDLLTLALIAERHQYMTVAERRAK